MGGYVDVNWFHMVARQGPPNLFNARTMIEAEFYDDFFKANTGICRDIQNRKDQEITETENGGWMKFDQIDFGDGVSKFYVRVSSEVEGSAIELHLDGLSGPLIGKCDISKTEKKTTYVTESCPVTSVKGKHALVLKFTGGEGKLMNINWFSFIDNPPTIKTMPEVMKK
jgi:hypothetical protein